MLRRLSATIVCARKSFRVIACCQDQTENGAKDRAISDVHGRLVGLDERISKLDFHRARSEPLPRESKQAGVCFKCASTNVNR